MPLTTGQKFKQTFLAFLYILVEIGLATLLFYAVIYLERRLGGFTSGDQNSDPILFWFGYVGKIVLLVVDGLIILFFSTRGCRNAYKETWGSSD
jgi:hypothetical protein